MRVSILIDTNADVYINWYECGNLLIGMNADVYINCYDFTLSEKTWSNHNISYLNKLSKLA